MPSVVKPVLRLIYSVAGSIITSKVFKPYCRDASEIDVRLRMGKRDESVLLAALRRDFSAIPGANINIGQPISHRIDHMLSGTRASIAVKVVGDDLLTLRRLGDFITLDCGPEVSGPDAALTALISESTALRDKLHGTVAGPSEPPKAGS